MKNSSPYDFGSKVLLYVTIRWENPEASIILRQKTSERIGGNWLLRNYLKPFLRMHSSCCEFGCYNRKLRVNQSISYISSQRRNVNEKIAYQLLK